MKSIIMIKKWELRLNITGLTDNSIQALNNLKEICEYNLKGEYSIEVVDLPERPELAGGEQITALPASFRKLPEPIVKIIGNLSNKEKVLVDLDLIPRV